MSTNVAFFETTLSLSSTVTSQGEDDDLLVYTVSLPTPTSAPAPKFIVPALVPVKPPITQVYSRRQNPLVLSLTPAVTSSYPVQNDDLSIALHKGKRQYAHPISSFVSYNHLLSSFYSFIASLDSIFVPNIVREALSNPGWRNAMMEKRQALDNKLGMINIYAQTRGGVL